MAPPEALPPVPPLPPLPALAEAPALPLAVAEASVPLVPVPAAPPTPPAPPLGHVAAESRIDDHQILAGEEDSTALRIRAVLARRAGAAQGFIVFEQVVAERQVAAAVENTSAFARMRRGGAGQAVGDGQV